MMHQKTVVKIIRNPVAPQVKVESINQQENRPNHIVYAESYVNKPLAFIAKVSGDLSTLNATPGQLVAAGDELMVLNTDAAHRKRSRVINDRKIQRLEKSVLLKKKSSLVRVYDSSVEQLNLHVSQQDRQEKLYKNNYLSQAAYDKTKSQLEGLKIAKNQAKQRLVDVEQQIARVESALALLDIDLLDVNEAIADATTISPHSGFIGEVNVVQSGYVETGQVTMTLIPVDALRLKAVIPQEIYRLLSRSDVPSSVMLNGQQVALDFDRFEPYFDQENGSIEAVFLAADSRLFYPLGQRFKLYIELPEPTVSFLVPLASVYPGGYIYIVENERLRRVDVEFHGYRFTDGEATRLIVSADSLPERVDVLVDTIPDAINGMSIRANDD
tara:strand:+ start:104 stop:1258 length:1155 start_codon:yes stop_codon:yes gene_type:complete